MSLEPEAASEQAVVAVSTADVSLLKPTVRQFRQIVTWPLEIERTHPAQDHLSADQIIERFGNGVWSLVEDEFGRKDTPLDERHYREFVSFLPHVQRFLYGDAAGPVRHLRYGEAPLRIYRRSDVAAVRVELAKGEAPIVCRISHIDLHFFYDIDVVILACEFEAADIPLAVAQDLMHRFGRAYPPGWNADGSPLHCAHKVEWLDKQGQVLATSDYENRKRYLQHVGQTRSPCFASHWEYLLKPMVPHGSTELGPLRFRQIEYYRMPVMAFLTVDRLRDISRSDMVCLAFAARPSANGATPYSEHFLKDFERQHCYDRFFHDQRAAARVNTRFLLCGQALTVIAEGDPELVDDNERGLLGQFRHQYYLLFLISHFHRAALLMLSDRLAAAVKRLEIRNERSAADFRREVYRLQEGFMRFTQRYWFGDISDQVQARDLFRMLRQQLDNDQLYRDLRGQIFDSVQYLDSDVLRRQTGSMHRLTAITIMGLIGTVATGFLGMNLIAAADQPIETNLSDIEPESRIAQTTRFLAKVLTGFPSILAGVFVYAVIVLAMGGYSAIAGGVALAVLMLPTIMLTAEEAMKTVPRKMKDAAIGMGCTGTQVIWKIVLPTALPGILTGVMLAVARVAGESAPLLFTALFSNYWLQSLREPTASLSILIYNFSSMPFENQIELAWAASLVLVLIVLVFNILSRAVGRAKS